MEPAVSQEGKQAITASNAESLLLRLPQEIKNHIYVLVCGGNLLHFDFGLSTPDVYIPFSHVKCLSKATEEDAQASFDASESPWFDEVNANRHEDCVSGRISPRLTLDLRFLRTCRQIHEEAKSFCYTANTFSFDGWNVFTAFMEKVSWTSYIRSVHLCFRCGTDGDNCGAPLTYKTMQHISSKLTGLRSIHYSLVKINVYRPRRYNQEVERASQLTEQLLCLAGTAVKTTTVVISDAYDHNFGFPKNTQPPGDDARSQALGRWTMAQKQEYSRFIRNSIRRHRRKRVDIEGDAGTSRTF